MSSQYVKHLGQQSDILFYICRINEDVVHENQHSFSQQLLKNQIHNALECYRSDTALIRKNTLPRKCDLWKLRVPLKIKIFLWHLKKG